MKNDYRKIISGIMVAFAVIGISIFSGCIKEENTTHTYAISSGPVLSMFVVDYCGFGGYQEGIEIEWLNDSVIEITTIVRINCAHWIGEGSSNLENKTIELIYEIKGVYGELVRCMCNVKLTYIISNLSRDDYEIVLNPIMNLSNKKSRGINEPNLYFHLKLDKVNYTIGEKINATASLYNFEGFSVNVSTMEILYGTLQIEVITQDNETLKYVGAFVEALPPSITIQPGEIYEFNFDVTKALLGNSSSGNEYNFSSTGIYSIKAKYTSYPYYGDELNHTYKSDIIGFTISS